MSRVAPIPKRSVSRWLSGVLLASCSISLGQSAGVAAVVETQPATLPVERQALVCFIPETSAATAREVCARHGLDLIREFPNLSAKRRYGQVRSADLTTAEIIVRLSNEPNIAFAEPNHRRTLAAMEVPSDTHFAKQWPLRNTGQYVNGFPGTPGADLRFLPAWGMTRSDSSIPVVGVLDSGIDLIHPDLVPNLWINPAETPGDNLDNDANGKIDDVNGYDFADSDSNPSDTVGHGTHLSGVIAAAANNSLGIAGVSFHARVMPLKITNSDGTIDVASELAAIDYAVMMKKRGVPLVALNASFSGPFESLAERDAIEAAATAGIVFCAAAGNDNSDNTATPVFPANHRLPNMIVVAASDSTDQLAGTSNYGTKVDLAAPGVDIYSTKPMWPTPYPSGAISPVNASLTHGIAPIPATAAVYSATTEGISANLIHCGYGGTPSDFPPAVKGNIALIQRGAASGSISFATKVTQAMKAGAKAAIIFNNVAGLFTPNLSTPGVWIPTQGISQADGQALLAALPTTVTLANVPIQTSIYFFADGTSTATPFVSAAVAFAARNFPNESANQRVARILGGVTPVGFLTGKVVTGGRLDLSGIVDPGANAIPDWWELRYFPSVGIDPAADPDGDRFTNFQEYQIGTEPNNPASTFKILEVSIVQNGDTRDFTITFPTANKVTYRVEFFDPNVATLWTALGSDLLGTGSPATVTDPNAVNLYPSRIYRVRLPAD